MSDDDDAEKKEGRWVELRRFNDPLEADMAKDFLESSGIPVLVRGNSGATGVLNRFDTILDIRLTVPASKLDLAGEALEAMQTPAHDHSETPFRGPQSQAPQSGDDEPIARKKSPFLAMGFALMLPIGAGHLYADHRTAGFVLGSGIIGASIMAIVFSAPLLWASVFILIAVDVLGSPLAVKRYNLGAVPSVGKQNTWAGLAVSLALLLVPIQHYFS
jgi:Putative prokaryotic signal transducing protein